MDGVLILNQWMMPTGAGAVWPLLGAVGIIIGIIALACDSDFGYYALVAGVVLFACFFIPFTNPWVPRYEVALNGATYEELQENYNILQVNGGIFTVEDK